MTGNANEELTITGPSGLVMTSRPSPLWTRVTAGPGRTGWLAAQPRRLRSSAATCLPLALPEWPS